MLSSDRQVANSILNDLSDGNDKKLFDADYSI